MLKFASTYTPLEGRPERKEPRPSRKRELPNRQAGTGQSVRDDKGRDLRLAEGERRRTEDRSRREAVSSLVKAIYEDDVGLKWVVLIPQGETDASLGVVQGPPDVSELGLPKEVARRLHNELFNRGLITARDVRGRVPEVAAAVQAAYKVDTATVLNLFSEGGSK